MANLPMPEGLDNSDLECVMLDVPGIDIRQFLPEFKEENFFYGDIPELKYAQGPVGAKTAHVTLLFGIHPSETYVDDVMAALDGWTPEDLYIRKVSYFPSYIDGQDYKCIVLEVTPSANLMNANRRLAALPHTNRFATYKPHITLAYVKGDVNIDKWINRLNSYFENSIVYPTALNLGLDD